MSDRQITRRDFVKWERQVAANPRGWLKT